MTSATRVRATALLDLPAVITAAGGDPYPALRQAGIDPAILARADLTIPAETVAWLLDGLAERHGISDLGLRIATHRRLANIGVAGLVLGQQATVRDALAMVERYRHLMSDSLSLHLSEADDMATAMLGLAIGAGAPQRQSRELGLAAFVHLFRLLLGEGWRPETVHFTHSAPQGTTLHRRFFGCPVQFDSAFDGFEFPALDLDRINPAADATLASYAASLLDALPGQEAGAVATVVTRLVHALLPMGNASLANVARAMGRNLRTLQRELAVQGLEFRTILATARDDLAQTYLRDPALTIDAIAERLGYASSTAFIRAFRARQGMTPGQARERAAGLQSHTRQPARLP